MDIKAIMCDVDGTLLIKSTSCFTNDSGND